MLDIDAAIKHCLDIADGQDKCAEISVSEHAKERISQCATEHRQLAEWLTELKQWRRVYGVCPSYEMCIPECKEGYNAQIAEYKRLLKAAVEDMNKEADCGICLHDNDSECPIKVTACKFKWRHAAEALALIGEDTNVPASADDTNVGHKSGGWISVNDRLPEAVEEDVNGKIAFSKSVLVYLVYDNGFTYITNDRFRVDSKSWLHEIPGEGCKVTHWMPLPEPPKDGEQDE